MGRAGPPRSSFVAKSDSGPRLEDGWQPAPSFLQGIMVACSAALTIRVCAHRFKSDIDTLCVGLENATSLTDLTLDLRDGFDGMPRALESILKSLQRNTSLVRFALDFHTRPEFNAFQAPESGRAFLRSLRRNGSLTHLCLRLGNIANNVNSSISGEIVEMLHFNTTLREVEGLTYESVEHERRISRLLLLNRYGEDFKTNATSVPIEDWGDLLMRVEKDECNFYVTELVLRAVEGREFQQHHRLPK